MRLLRSSVLPFGPHGLLLTLEDEDGRIGIGEASPLPRYSDESVESARTALDGIHAGLGIMGEQGSAAEVLARTVEPVARALQGVPSARFALETALLDLLGQRSGRSIAACFGQERSPIARSGLVRADAPDASVRAAACVRRGLTTIKIKIGAGDWDRELAMIRATRTELGPNVELRADANGRFDVDVARSHLRDLAPLGLRFVEQPVAPHRLENLGVCATPWAADESLRLPGAADRLARAPGCAAFILKPAVLGGFLAARAMARLAYDAGLDVVVTHLMDGPVAIAAACELALSLEASLACGLDRHDDLDAWPAIAIPQLATDGWITSSAASGLGIPFDSRAFVEWTSR